MTRLLALLLAGLSIMCSARAERATERYAAAQLRVAQAMLERAREAAALGETGRAGMLAWQADLDARLAWGMTDSPALRDEAAEIGGEARALITGLAARQ